VGVPTKASQYAFNHKELVTMMIKETGVHEGKWMLSINFGLSATNAGSGPDQVNPAAIATVQSIGIAQADDVAPPSLVVDANEVNLLPPANSTTHSRH
jgi:hypothetical protein